VRIADAATNMAWNSGKKKAAVDSDQSGNLATVELFNHD